MIYLITFIEGIITFISPCLLPMLPIYIAYFAGFGKKSRGQTLLSALAFILGFTLVFMAMGALAGSIGNLFIRYQGIINLVTGGLVIFIGLGYLGVLNIPFFQANIQTKNMENLTPLRSFLFGLVFSIAWTPCVGTFLGSALLQASQQAHFGRGMLMLLSYSLGLGIPFLLSAIFIDQLKSSFDWIKNNYDTISKISGGLLVLLGILMATGLLSRLLNYLA